MSEIRPMGVLGSGERIYRCHECDTGAIEEKAKAAHFCLPGRRPSSHYSKLEEIATEYVDFADHPLSLEIKVMRDPRNGEYYIYAE